MTWQVLASDEFEAWYRGLGRRQADDLDARVELLVEQGPDLGRPIVERIGSSEYHHLKELRSTGGIRVLFAFDPQRRAVLLVGGDKTGDWERWYRRAIPVADRLYQEHLRRSKE
jgi:hypothetical protein